MNVDDHSLRVLRALEDENHLNKFELASASGLSPSAVETVAKQLTDRGLVSVGAQTGSERYAIDPTMLRAKLLEE